jgi:hypothetical protein
MRRAVIALTLVATSFWREDLGPVPVEAQTTRSAYVSVVDDDGQRINGLTSQDFMLKEGGDQVRITSVGLPAEALHLTIVVEEVLANVGDVRLGIYELAKRMMPPAHIGLVVVGNRAETVVEHTGDINAVVAGLNSFLDRHSRSAGNVTEAVFEVFRTVEASKPARPAIIAIAIETGQTSGVAPERVLGQLRSSRAVFHAVTVGDGRAAAGGAYFVPNLSPNVSAVTLLQEMAGRSLVLGEGPRQSGGRHVELTAPDGMADALRTIGDELSAQYLITWELPEGVEPDGKLEVSVRRPGVVVRAPMRIAD